MSRRGGGAGLRALRVEGPAAAFAGLVAAAAERGLLIGWLEWCPQAAAPRAIEDAASGGAARAVAVAPGRTLSLKTRRGEPVLRDLLREHFSGFDLVLVRAGEGDVAGLPLLLLSPGGFRLRRGSTEEPFAVSDLPARDRRGARRGSKRPRNVV
jgi:hypothetical protein